MKKIFLSLVATTLVSASLYSSDATILAFDKKQAIHSCKEGKELSETFKKKKENLDKELQDKANKIKTEGEAFEKQARANLLTPEAFFQKQNDLNKKMKDFERTSTAKNEDLQADLESKANLLTMKMEEIAREVSKSKNAKVLLDLQAGPALYISADIDITDEVITKADSEHSKPKKAATTTSSNN